MVAPRKGDDLQNLTWEMSELGLGGQITVYLHLERRWGVKRTDSTPGWDLLFFKMGS